MPFARNEAEQLLADTGRRCCICDTLHNVQLHHIVAKEDGGTDEIDNAIPLCPNCHNEVHVGYAQGRVTRLYSPSELRLHRQRTIEQVRKEKERAPEHGTMQEFGASGSNEEAITEDTVKKSDPNNLVFREIELKLSDVWDQFLSWAQNSAPSMTLESISEDVDTAEPTFYCSGKPGALHYNLAIHGHKAGRAFTQKLDIITAWLHPLIANSVSPEVGTPWDTSLFPVEDELDKEVSIKQPLADCRDCFYSVQFVRLR